MPDTTNRTSGIYGIYCTVTKKWYVGASKDVDKRLSVHKSNLKTCWNWGGMYEDAKKYGLQNMRLVVLERVGPKDLPERENFWIKKLEAKTNGYNKQTAFNNRYWG